MASFLSHARVIHRHPLITLALNLQMPQARELDMRCGNEVAFPGRFVEDAGTRFDGSLGVHVETDGYLGVLQLYGGHVDQVAEHDHLAAVTFDDVGSMARRVPIARYRFDAGT